MIRKQDIIRSKYMGQLAKSNTLHLNLRQGPGTDYPVIDKLISGEKIGYIVGYYRYKRNGYTWYLFRLYSPVHGHSVGWVAKGLFSHQPVKISKQDTKKMIQALVNNDIVIYKRLLIILTVLNRLRKLGYDVTHYNTVAKKLAVRYNARQKLLRETKALKTVNYGSEMYNKIRQSLITSGGASGREWGFRGLGAAPVVIALAVGAVIGIAVSITLYYLFKPKYDESTQDLKISETLKQALDTLPEDQRKAVTADLERQIDDAYNQGKTDQAFGSLFTFGKYVLFGVVVYKAIDFVSQHKEQPSNQTNQSHAV